MPSLPCARRSSRRAPSVPLTSAELEVLAHALERANWGGGAAGVSPRDRLLGLLRPLPLGRDAAPLVDALRDRLASSGAFFEAHAARALTEGAHATVTPDLQGDVRWLLAALEREAIVQPEIEPLRQRLIQDVAARQLDVALASVKDGEVRVDVPVAFGHVDTTARLAVKDDGPPPGPGERPRGRAITLTVAHPELGPIEASAQWQPGGSPGDLQVRFAVRDAESASALDAADERSRRAPARRGLPPRRHRRRRRSRRGAGDRPRRWAGRAAARRIHPVRAGA